MDITKLLLMGGAAYLGYNYFLKPAVAQDVLPVAGIVPALAPGVNAQTTKNLVQAAATKDNFTFGNVWQWDFYYNKVRGVEANLADKIADDQRMKNLTFDEWWSVAQANGLSGVIPTNMPMMRGVGYIPTGRLMVMEME